MHAFDVLIEICYGPIDAHSYHLTDGRYSWFFCRDTCSYRLSRNQIQNNCMFVPSYINCNSL